MGSIPTRSRSRPIGRTHWSRSCFVSGASVWGWANIAWLPRAFMERPIAVLLIAPGVGAGVVRWGPALGGDIPRVVGRGGGRRVGHRRDVTVHRRGTLTWSFDAGARRRNGIPGRVGGRGLRDDLSRRVGVLAGRAAAAPSWVKVVCHYASDYQSAAIGDALKNPSATMATVRLEHGGLLPFQAPPRRTRT
jgi:hypothetical protein